ncbi:hypothetical protein AOQ84DRAFT_172243 [Glonium stellatum]|uniref:Uncharacterized protein n=1 Tax=Glonium stellatum TaxID=574774 RepID=A0A8E2JWM5_9PEZI|nr:hypothetical protein AOQ84DRAFT_172243 [Glonium stellatum]
MHATLLITRSQSSPSGRLTSRYSARLIVLSQITIFSYSSLTINGEDLRAITRPFPPSFYPPPDGHIVAFSLSECSFRHLCKSYLKNLINCSGADK